jgi:type IX secretion system PorP/SprF family membrane protein
MIKYCFFISCLVLFVQNVKGQFLPEFSQQIKMPEFINPGYNGLNKDPSAKFLYSDNYLNSNGYNGLLAVGYNFPVKKWATGFGFTLINESVGVILKTTGTVSISVNKKISKFTYLTFGLGFGLEFIDNSEIKNNLESVSSAKLFTSNYYYTTSGLNLFSKNMHVGIGVHSTQLDKKRYFKDEFFTYFLNGSYNFVLSESPSIKPLFLYRYYMGNSHYELGFLMNFSKVFETGLAYRFKGTINYFAAITFFKVAVIGYSYLYQFDESTYFYEGIHELSLAIKLPYKYL